MVDLPALKRAVIIETSELVLVAGEEDREAAVRLAGEVIVHDRDAAARVCDVRVQGVVRLARAHAIGRNRVDEMAT